MQYYKYLPSENLQDHVHYYWSMSGDLGTQKMQSRDIPDGNLEVIINLGSAFNKIDGASSSLESVGAIKGQFDHPVIIEQMGKIEIIGICFKPYGLYPFLKLPLSEITNGPGPLELLINHETIDRLYHARLSGNWQQVLDRTLEAKLGQIKPIDTVVKTSVKYLYENNGFTVGKSLEKSGISTRTLERRYQEWIGLTPKQFSRLIRVRKILYELESSLKPNWMQFVVRYGLYDRSHLCHEFLQFTGASPTQFLELGDTFSDNYSSNGLAVDFLQRFD